MPLRGTLRPVDSPLSASSDHVFREVVEADREGHRHTIRFGDADREAFPIRETV